MRKIDLTGKSFGRLLVLEQAPTRVSPKGTKMVYWRCRCSCGNLVEISGGLLRSGNTVSCGCYHKEQQKRNKILQPKDMLGKKIGQLLVVEYAGSKNNFAMWKCQCDCGNPVIVSGADLRNGKRVHCSSKIHKKKHGGYGDRLYSVFRAIQQRCYNSKCRQYNDYGGRGITMCQEWRSDYAAFRDWALATGYIEEVLPNGMNKWTIDRINVNGNYEPSNCRWITCQEQQFNKRDNVVLTYNGETKTAKEFSEQYNISPAVLWQRIKKGWSAKAAIETPVRKRRNNAESSREGRGRSH